MASTIKVDNVQNQPGTNIINKCGTTITLGASSDTIALAAGASQTGFGRTGTVDWITTPKVTGDSPITAVTGKGYFLNTTAGTITVNLPAGVAGSIVSLADYAATWQTNNVTVTPNGTDKIGSLNYNATLNTSGQSVTFVYVDSTQGWINTMDSTSNVRGAPPFVLATGGDAITTCGDYKTHIFTGPGTFCVSAASSCAAENKVDYFVVAGGGGGSSGGAGAGGFRTYSTAPGCNSPLNNYGASPNTEVTVTSTAYPIVVGGGGTGTTGSGTPYSFPVATSGVGSTFSTVTSAGGGNAGNNAPSGPIAFGGPGGSGGGAGYGPPGCGGATIPAGTGNTPPVSPAQGFPGGTGVHNPGIFANTGSGGGATVAGINGAPATPTPGGAGSYIADTFIGPTAPSYGESGPVGSTRYFAGGGAGDGCAPSTGGVGGGGDKRCGPGTPPSSNGVINTGGGSGAGFELNVSAGATGGSGIVMIRYKFQ